MTDAPSSFPFLKLPAELRWRILLQTDLVTPCGCVEYSSGKLVALHGALLEQPRVERYAQNNDSEEYTHVNTSPQTTDNDDSWDPDWRSPEALLLVSRAFSGLAQRVLLSQNHVEVYGGLSEEAFECLRDNDDGAAWEEALRRDAATCQAAMFVSSAARCEVLASLRSLEISFPRSHGDRTTPSGAVLQWQKAVQRFSKTLNPRRLIMHIKGDESIPIIKTVFGTHPLVFRQGNLERHDIIDLVRQSVEIYWPLGRLTRLDGVRMFLWDVDWGVEGSKLVYYCRHRSEELPRMAGDMDLFEPLPSPIFHTQKECQRRDGSAASAEHDEQEARQPTSWVEGIFVRPGDEDERWIRYYEEMKALS